MDEVSRFAGRHTHPRPPDGHIVSVIIEDSECKKLLQRRQMQGRLQRYADVPHLPSYICIRRGSVKSGKDSTIGLTAGRESP
jgi:hypothetical protein